MKHRFFFLAILFNLRKIFFAFFETVTNAVDISLLLHNNPKRQAIDISPKLIRK
jgi:dihydrodipicolinate synthase/N-acetylneuraminate lyase